GGSVPPAVGRGIVSAYVEDRHAHGDAADEEPGDGAEGGRGASAGVQPDPRRDGRGGADGGGAPAAVELPGCVARGAVVRGDAPVRPGADRGRSAAAPGADWSEAGGRPS